MLLKFEKRKKIYLISAEMGLDWFKRHVGVASQPLYLPCHGFRDDEQFNEAIDSFPKNPGGHVYMTEGPFGLAGSIAMKPFLRITGAGMGKQGSDGATTLKPTTNAHVFTGPDAQLDAITLADFAIRKVGARSTGNAINFNPATWGGTCNSSSAFEKLSIENFAAGFYSKFSGWSDFKVIWLKDCDEGFHFVDGSSSTFLSCYPQDCTVGYRIEGLSYSVMIACACDGAVTAYRLGGDNVGDAMSWITLTLLGCGCTGCTGNPIHMRQVWGPIVFLSGKYLMAAGGDRDGCLGDGDTGVRDFLPFGTYFDQKGTGKRINIKCTDRQYGGIVIGGRQTDTDTVDGSGIRFLLGDEAEGKAEYVYMYNSSGADRDAGTVVVTAITHDPMRFFYVTAVGGDDLIKGVLMEDTLAATHGRVQKIGPCPKVHVNNDNGDIAIGDFLCASTTNDQAYKAAADDMAFAQALEACALPDCDIKALLITPRRL